MLLSALSAPATQSVQWLSTVHNFGAIHEDMGNVTAEFRFVNTGDEDISIVAARATCGCTAPQYSKKSVAPGDTSEVTVSFNPTLRPGRFSKKVYVDFSYPDSRMSLEIKGTVIGTPATLEGRYPVDAGAIRLSRGAVMFGETRKDKVRNVMIDGYNASTDSVTPTFADMPAYMQAVSSPEIVAPGVNFVLSFYFDSSKCPLYGFVSDSLRVRTSSENTVTLPAMAIVTEDFSRLTPGEVRKAPVAELSADALDAGKIRRADGAVSLSFRITNAGQNKLEIRRIYTTDGGVDVSCGESSLRKGHSAEVTVTVDPGAVAGDYVSGIVNVITNDPNRPVQKVRVAAELTE